VDVEFALASPGLPPGAMATLGWAIADRVRNVIAQDLEDLKASLEPQLTGRDVLGRMESGARVASHSG
jgi:hypothetical protein